MKDVYLEHIKLQNYRNFLDLSLNFTKNVNIIVGKNGSGKTNILESISLLSPGKGLKSAYFNDICKTGESNWNSCFNLTSKVGVAEITTSFSSSERSRKINYNGSPISSTEFPNLLNVIWLTPQMEDLFLGSSISRRKYLDRVVYNFDKTHAKNVTQYEHFLRERKKTLENRDFESDGDWLTNIEEKISSTAKLIYYSRCNAIKLMQQSINSLDSKFPKANLKITDLFDDIEFTEDNFIKLYKEKLLENRQKDAYSGRSNFGIHKCDMIVFHKEKNQPAKLCSTGEQKALLISLTISSIEFILHNTKTKPILLLDELFVHLDDIRKKHLADYINTSKLQTFITTTDIIGIEELANDANIINL